MRSSLVTQHFSCSHVIIALEILLYFTWCVHLTTEKKLGRKSAGGFGNWEFFDVTMMTSQGKSIAYILHCLESLRDLNHWVDVLWKVMHNVSLLRNRHCLKHWERNAHSSLTMYIFISKNINFKNLIWMLDARNITYVSFQSPRQFQVSCEIIDRRQTNLRIQICRWI